MAKFASVFQFYGTIDGATGYRRPGSDQTFIRKCNPHSKSRMYNDSCFTLPMQNAKEFGGSSMASSALRIALGPVRHLKAPGFNIISKGNKLFKAIQQVGEFGDRGERPVICSAFKQYLEGFNLNPNHSLTDIILPQIHCNISREQGTAHLELPELVNGVSLKLPWNTPIYRLIFHFSVLGDVLYQQNQFCKMETKNLPGAATWYSNWQYPQQIFHAEKVILQLENIDMLNDNMSLILSAGIEIGVPVTDMLIEPDTHKGSAKILAVA